MAGSARREPPVSPHVSVWRWHVTMAGSIANRVTGVALYAGALGLVGWLLALAAGPEAYQPVADALETLPAQLMIYAMLVAAAYHLAKGIQHLVWDGGVGYEPKTANRAAWFSFLFSVLAPIGVYAVAGF